MSNNGKMLALAIAMQETAGKKAAFDRIMAKRDKILEMLDPAESLIFLDSLEMFATREIAKLEKIRKMANEEIEQEFDPDKRL